MKGQELFTFPRSSGYNLKSEVPELRESVSKNRVSYCNSHVS